MKNSRTSERKKTFKTDETTLYTTRVVDMSLSKVHAQDVILGKQVLKNCRMLKSETLPALSCIFV